MFMTGQGMTKFIKWPVKHPELSDKDKKWKTLKETKKY